MKAIVYTTSGGPDVLTLTDRPVPEPGPGEVRVKVRVSGVNPTDWKSRQGTEPERPQVPNQDGSGVIDAVGAGVPAERVGERVWLWESAHRRPDGTAQEVTTVPARQAVPLPDGASFDLGASIGVPAITAHRALTVAEYGPTRLAPGALDGRTVLVAGGAGAVGNAAIQLARWAGATVITTVSGPEKAALATAAGAHHVVNYREQDAAAEIRRIAPDGVHIVVEVAPAHNVELDAAVTANNAVIAFYADDSQEFVVPVRPSMFTNLRWQGLLLYTVPDEAKDEAVAAISAALADGALRAGPEVGLPFHRFPLERTAEAHEAVRDGAVGKVLIDVAS
ncbi:NADPH:quinone reductase [Streptomyces sp. NBC_00669]|uniref:NADPH:quinone reductase n=1 Tax=Streptomyces sp. NBC_00669 TaxID=2976011 RepID=UPI002E3815C5|nr:NADPH:quinone reductase [Streptomyces sp. NBC_00669]